MIHHQSAPGRRIAAISALTAGRTTEWCHPFEPAFPAGRVVRRDDQAVSLP